MLRYGQHRVDEPKRAEICHWLVLYKYFIISASFLWKCDDSYGVEPEEKFPLFLPMSDVVFCIFKQADDLLPNAVPDTGP